MDWVVLIAIVGLVWVAASRPVPSAVAVAVAAALTAARWAGGWSHDGVDALDDLHARWTGDGVRLLAAIAVGRTLAARGRLRPVAAVVAAVAAESLGYTSAITAFAFALYWASDARDPTAASALAASGAWAAGRLLAWPLLLPDHVWSGLAAPLAVCGGLLVAGPRPVLVLWAALGLAAVGPYTWASALPVGSTGQKMFVSEAGVSFSATWPEAASRAWVEPWPADTSLQVALAASDGVWLRFLHRDPGWSGIWSLGVTEIRIGADERAEIVLDPALPWTLGQIAATCVFPGQCRIRRDPQRSRSGTTN